MLCCVYCEVRTVLLRLLHAVSRGDCVSINLEVHRIAWHFRMRLATVATGGPSKETPALKRASRSECVVVARRRRRRHRRCRRGGGGRRRDVAVSVFETNIRVVGGLVSAHILAELLKGRGAMAWYQGQMLDMALDVGHRLLPAFNSTTGLPHPR